MAANDLGREREGAIAAYLAQLRHEVRDEVDADEIIAEAEDHLRSAVDRQSSLGVPEEVAVERSLRSFGRVEDVGVGYRGRDLRAGLAVATRRTRRGGRWLQVAAVSVVLAMAVFVATEVDPGGVAATDWAQAAWILGTGLLVVSAGTGAVGAQALLVRHGHQRGPTAVAAGALLTLGVLASTTAWAALIWTAALGLGWGAVHAVIRHRTLLSRLAVHSSGFGYGAAFVGTLVGALVGRPEASPNWQVVGLLPGIVTQAVGMWLAGATLADEIALDHDGAPVSTV